jgi:hypothetical protein
MKTIISANNLSKYILEDNTQVTFESDCIKVGSLDDLDFTISDLNSNNSTLIENIAPPDDWYGNKYFYNNGFVLNPDWIDLDALVAEEP